MCHEKMYSKRKKEHSPWSVIHFPVAHWGDKLHAYPPVYAIKISLTNFSFLTGSRFIGLENYVTMLTKDPLVWKSLGITFLYAIFAVPLQLIFGFLLANLLNQKLRGIVIFRTIFYIPCLIVVVSSTLLWKQMLETDFGIINYLLTRIGLGKVSWLGSTGTIIASTVFISIWQSGKMIIINLSGLQAIPTVLYEAADLDGCSKLRQVFHITLPMMSCPFYESADRTDWRIQDIHSD